MSEYRISAETATFLFFLGMLLIFLGILVTVFGFLPTNRVESAGVIIIGPFPIIFQGEISPFIFLAITLLLTILFIIAVFVFTRKFAERRVDDE